MYAIFLRPFTLVPALLVIAGTVLAADQAPAADKSPAATAPAKLDRQQAERAKAAVIAVAQERLRLAQEAGLPTADEEADLAEVAKLDPLAMATPVTDAPHLALFKPVTAAKGNPHLDTFIQDLRKDLAKPDAVWRRATEGNPVFNDLGNIKNYAGRRDDFGVRSNGGRLRDYLWAYANPASPLKGDPELLTRLLRRAHAFIDAYPLHSGRTLDKPDLFDQFSLEAAIGGLVEFRRAYPGLLLPKQRDAWDQALAGVADKLWGMMANARAWNLNIETARMFAVLNLGYLTGREEMVEKVLNHVDTVLAKMRADGGWPYNGDSNPSVNYHNELTYTLLRIYDMTGHQPIADALKEAAWKGPVMGRTDEFWTSPFHKTIRWNYPRGTEAGPEAGIALSGNSMARWVFDHNADYGNRDDITWWRPDVKAQPLPDRVTYRDRNTDGPRAWYGNFTHSITYHAVPKKEAGHETLMGAMTVDDDGRLNSVLTAVTPRVRLHEADVVDNGGKVEDTAWGRLTADLQASYVIGRSWSAGTATHDITTVRKGAYRGLNTGWKARQMWIGLPDRVIGLVSTVPGGTDDAVAYEVDGVLRFISAGAAGAKEAKTLVETSPNHYRFGQLDVVVHGSTYRSAEIREVAYRKPDFPAYELTFRAVTGETPTQTTTFPAASDFTAVVEVRPTWATGAAKVTWNTEGPVLKLDAVVGTRTVVVRTNVGTEPAKALLTVPTGAPASFRLVEPNGSSATPVKDIPAGLTLQPGQQAVVIASPEASDHLAGWDSFADLVAATPAAPAKPSKAK